MIPILPIVLAVAGLASGVASGISSVKNAKESAKAVQEQALSQINERAKQARLLMSKQKTSFLKGGVYFDSGSPEAVINETYDTAQADINDMIKDANTKSSNYIRQGKTAFFTSLLGGIMNGAMGYAGATNLLGSAGASSSSLGDTLLGSKFAQSFFNTKAGNNIYNWYNNKRGWSIGTFDSATDTKLS